MSDKIYDDRRQINFIKDSLQTLYTSASGRVTRVRPYCLETN